MRPTAGAAWGAALLLALLPALAEALEVRLVAEVDADLRTIRGTLSVDDAEVELVDLLARLPEPEDELSRLRTWPGRPDQGSVRFQVEDDGLVSFETTLPRRFGDLGATRHGLFANGGWYPQPLVDGAVPVASFEVTVSLPPGQVGALGDIAGSGTLRWSGEGERVSLSVPRRATVTPLLEDGMRVLVLTGPNPRPELLAELATQLDLARPAGLELTGVVVEAPLRRRLVRPGVGTAYVSDRAFRVAPVLRRFHRVSVTRGVVQGLLPLPDPYARELAAAGISLEHAERQAGPNARQVLALGSWTPGLHSVLHSGRLPFHAEVLEDVHPGDPLDDDLLEVLDAHAPGTAVLAQVDALYGRDAALALTGSLLATGRVEASAEAAGIPAEWLLSWRSPYPAQDYRLQVHRDPPAVVVERHAPEDAPAEALVVAVDGERHTWVAGPGPDRLALPREALPGRVGLDPDRLVRQTSRRGDAWPPRWAPTVSGWVDTIDLTNRFLVAGGAVTIRRSDDTRNLWSGVLATERENLLIARLGYIRREGRQLDGLSRPHRFNVWVAPALLDPRFAPTDEGRVALGAGLNWSWSNRMATWFPTQGHHLSAGVDGGIIPGSERRWGALRLGTGGVVSPHPRHALAGRLTGGLATGDVAHRLLPLGGPGSLRSVPAGAAVGTARGVGMAEYRVALIRNATVPMLLGRGTELQLTAGAEAGVVRLADGPASGAGATLGITGVGEALGVDLRMMGLTFAWPLWVQGVEVERTGWPVIYVRWGQAF